MSNILINLSGRRNSGPALAYELGKALSEDGHNIYALVSAQTINLNDWIQAKHIKKIMIINTYTNLSEALFQTIVFFIKKRNEITYYFRDIEFDCVINPIFHVWSEYIASDLKTNRIVTICHDPIMHSGEGKLKQFLYKRHIRSSTDVIVLTRHFIKTVCDNYGFYEKNVHYMPHGIYSNYKKLQNHSYHIGYAANSINFLFFGRIEGYKGIQILAQAFEIVCRKHTNITLTIAGKGNIAPYIKNLKGYPNVNIYNSYIKDDEVGCFFDGPNIVAVLPYLDATQSGVTVIAMEYGVPVIASDTGGLKEQLSNGQVGIFVEPGNATDLALKMEQFICDKELYSRQKLLMLSEAENLTWNQIAKNYLTFLWE